MNRNIAVMMMSIALFTGQVCLAPGASGQDISAPNQFELEYVGSAMWGEYHDIARNGDYVYCAMTNGLQILDISDPTNPVLAKRVFLNRVALSVALLDDRLYLGCRDGYLYQYSVSDPANPVLLGEMNLDFCGRINDIVPRNDTVFLACQMGMYVVDIGDLSDPEVVGTYVELGYHPEARALELIGDTLHLCAGAFAMVDVSNPAQPTKIASYDVWGEAYDVIVEDDLIYLVDHDVSEPSGYSRFLILSSAEPDTLEVVGSYIFWGHLKDIAEIDSYIFCATEYSGVVVLDVSAPPNLSLAGCLFPHLGEVVDIEVSDNLAFVANRAPQPHTYTAFHNVCDGDSIAITVPPNEHANSGDFVALDVSDRASPKMIGRYPFSGWADHVTTCGDYAFVISEMGDMAIVDISSPGSMRAVSRIDVPERIRSEPAVQGSYVYVAGRYDGLLVVDVSNVYEPEVVGEIDWGGWAYSVVVQGDYAYVTDFGFGLVVINVSDPAALDLVGSLPIDGSSYDIAIYADYVFVSGLGAGLHLVDVSDPEHPQYVSHRSITARELALVGDRLCSVSDSVEILDISGAPNLELLGAYHVSWPWIYGLSVSENYAILALADLGIQVVDITDPGAPQLVSTFDTPSFSTGVDVGGDMVCIADIYSLISLRLPDPTDVEEPPGHDSFLPTGYELYQNRPNPFNPSTQIAYDIPSGTDVRLSIHNILGQQVRILVDSYETAGHHTVVWDGCDSRGNPVASGVYFYRLAAGGESRSLKMLLLK